MTTLILVCLFNISPTNTDDIRYMPISSDIVEASKNDESSKALRLECSKVAGQSIDLAYVQ